jgi:8-oxo-dGTP pyrophosphatase MutT (NUDIX family)
MKQATLCFLIKNDEEILLAMKKKGFGQGRWNGVGGKLDFNKGDKDIFDAAIRETKEESGVTVKDIEKVAILNFYFPYQKRWNQEVHVFVSRNWQGEPKESGEVRPKWFKINEIPFAEMWPDDSFWLSRVLNGERLKGNFIFGEGEVVSSYNIKTVNRFD